MSASAARTVLRPSRLGLRRAPARLASTTSEAASKAKDTAANATSKAKETASQATSKASEGLTKVSQSAGSAATSASQSASNAASAVSARAGALSNIINNYAPGVVYYSRVTAELARLVFHGQKMQPPSMAQFQQYFQHVTNAARNPSAIAAQNPGLFSPQQYLSYFRNLSNQQLATIGIVSAEVLGFFTVGEMLGRFKLVGYRGEPAHH